MSVNFNQAKEGGPNAGEGSQPGWRSEVRWTVGGLVGMPVMDKRLHSLEGSGSSVGEGKTSGPG